MTACTRLCLRQLSHELSSDFIPLLAEWVTNNEIWTVYCVESVADVLSQLLYICKFIFHHPVLLHE